MTVGAIYIRDTGDAEDRLHDERVQRELDDALDALKAHEAAAQKPIPQQCHACEAKYAGVSCPNCHAERPAFIALKAMSKPAVRTDPFPVCPNYPQALCACGLTNQCLGGTAA